MEKNHCLPTSEGVRLRDLIRCENVYWTHPFGGFSGTTHTYTYYNSFIFPRCRKLRPAGTIFRTLQYFTFGTSVCSSNVEVKAPPTPSHTYEPSFMY